VLAMDPPALEVLDCNAEVHEPSLSACGLHDLDQQPHEVA